MNSLSHIEIMVRSEGGSSEFILNLLMRWNEIRMSEKILSQATQLQQGGRVLISSHV